MSRKSKFIAGGLLVYAILSVLIVFTSSGAGEVFKPTVSGPSFLEEHGLPALARMDSENTAKRIEPLQVMKKIGLLDLTDYDLSYPAQNYELLSARFEGMGEAKAEEVDFEGSLTSELNAALKANAGKRILVHSAVLTADETILVPDDTQLVGRGTRLTGELDRAFALKQARNVVISGFTMDGGFGYGVYCVDGEGIVISDCEFTGLSHKPVVFMGDGRMIVVRNNRMRGNMEGGLYFNGDAQYVLIEDNDMSDNYGTSNWMAGIVLTAIDVQDVEDVYAAFREDLHFPAEQRLDSMLKAPHDVILRNNEVGHNNSSGIYCDGPYKVFLVENRIAYNDKEGICLDYGTVGAYVADNDIIGNGNRGRQTDEDLAMDFVLAQGRMSDGSSLSKLPGISIDNAAYNIVYSNRISMNYGSGVKMVRTGVRNIVSTNLISDNNRSPSDTFSFFGVELGAAEADAPAENLDFEPDYENIICRNMITGHHYAGIYMAKGSFINDLFDNSIFDVTTWSIESETDEFNSCLNNVSHVQSRGIPLSLSIAVPVAGMVNK